MMSEACDTILGSASPHSEREAQEQSKKKQGPQPAFEPCRYLSPLHGPGPFPNTSTAPNISAQAKAAFCKTTTRWQVAARPRTEALQQPLIMQQAVTPGGEVRGPDLCLRKAVNHEAAPTLALSATGAADPPDPWVI